MRHYSLQLGILGIDRTESHANRSIVPSAGVRPL